MITGTPYVSKYYIVLGISRILLTPADTTVTGVFPIYLRSALISIVSATSRWTPPIPPVTKMSIPAIEEHIIVADTVVEPSYFLAIAYGISLRLIFLTLDAFASMWI